MIAAKNDAAPCGRLVQALEWGTGLLALGAAWAPAPSEARVHHRISHAPLPPATLPEADSLRAAPVTSVAVGSTADTAATALLPLPKVSLVVPNFARPRNVERITQQVSGYNIVDETLVWDMHQDPVHEPSIDAAKTWVIRTPQTLEEQKWGLMTRFKDCLLAGNEWVLITDDDQLLGEADIEAMVRAKLQDPDRLVCYFGRETGEGNTTGSMHYRVWDPPAPAEVPICLTKSVLTDRRFCLEAVRTAPLVEDIARAGVPYWNGEDIWHSLVAFQLTGKQHLLLPRNDSSYEILPAPNGIGDARPGPFDHRRHREIMVQEGSRRLGLNVSAMHWRPLQKATLASRR